MKCILIMLSFILCSTICVAADSTIVLRQMNFSDVLNLAKQEKKGVMLYFHFDGCTACKEMERTAFKDKKVSEYYNTNFINVSINALKGEGIQIDKRFNIKTYPSFVFLDPAGNELHRFAGVFNPEEFYKRANDALLTPKNLANYKKQYNEGNRNPEFLYDYVYMLRDADELDSTVVNEYLDAIDERDYPLEKNVRFIYEFCMHQFKIFMPFNSPKFNFLINHKKLFYKYFDYNQVKARIVWILNHAISIAIDEKDEIAFSQAMEVLKDYDSGELYRIKEMNGRTKGVLMTGNLVDYNMLNYYRAIGDTVNYQKALDVYLEKIWNDPDELSSYAWRVFEQAKSKEQHEIDLAIKCSKRAIELNSIFAYYQRTTYAWLLFKSGDTANAFNEALKAIDLAKISNQDASKAQELIDAMNKKK